MTIVRFCKIVAFVVLSFALNTTFAQNSVTFKPQILSDVLYHGSPHSDITILDPRVGHVRDNKGSTVVFATPSIRLASCYLFRWDDSWVHQFISTNDDGSYEVYMVISGRKRFDDNDSGGAIYLLPSKGFYFEKKKGLGIYEMFSRYKVMPSAEIRFVSALDAMKKFGVKVFFVSPEQLKVFLKLGGYEKEKFLEGLK